MRDLEMIHRQLELVAVTLSGRVERIQDSLRALGFVTRRALRAPPPPAGAIERWLAEQELIADASGFFERRAYWAHFREGAAAPAERWLFGWRATERDPEIVRQAYELYGIRELLETVRGQTHGAPWAYIQLAANPHVVLLAAAELSDISALLPSDFDWRTYHSYKIGAPEQNPGRTIAWSAPNIDYGGAGLISCVSIPVYDGDEFLGVCSLDIRLKDLHANLALGRSGAVGERQTSFLFDQDGYLIAYPGIEPIEAASEKGAEHRVALSTLGGDFETLAIDDLVARGSGQLEIRDATGERLVFAFRVIPELRWIVAASTPAADMVDAINAAFGRAFERLGSGDLSTRLDAGGNEAVQQLVASYNEMAEALSETMRRREHAEAEQRRLALERERLSRELEIAATIQLAMLPRDLRHVEFDFAGRMIPADEVGGDFYDVLRQPDGSGPLWITIGDVSGHGLGAGLLMMIAQAAFESVYETEPRMAPDSILRHVNRLLHTNVSQRLGGNRYVTCQLLVYRGGGAFECVGAHVVPLVYRPATREIVEREVHGPWLGVLDELPAVPVERVVLDPGDVLVLYSDGIAEARDASGEQFDVARIKQLVVQYLGEHGNLDRCADALLDAVKQFAPHQDDDRTLLLVRRRPHAPS